jgi:hypothetical protein
MNLVLSVAFFVLGLLNLSIGKVILASSYIFLSIFGLFSCWLHSKKPLVTVSRENIVISRNLFYSKVIEWGNIREIKKITRGKISLLVQDRDFTGDLLLKTVNIYLSVINRNERESLIQTIKELFELSKKPQEILPANQPSN